MAEPTGSGSGVLQPPGPAADAGRAKPRGGRTTLDNMFNWTFNVIDKSSANLKRIANTFRSTEREMSDTAKRFKSSVNSIGSGIMFTAGAALGFLSNVYNKVSSFATKAISESIDYQDTFIGLGKSMYNYKEGLSGAYQDLGKLIHYQGISIETSKEMIELGRDYTMTGDKLVKWAKASIDYARATGQSETAVGKLFHRMTRLYGLGDNQLRGMGSAMKYIASQTNISNDELFSFTSGMEKFFRLGPKHGKEASIKITTDMMAIAGAFKDSMGEDAEAITNAMTKWQDPFLRRPMASIFAQIVGKGMGSDEVENMMKDAPAQLWEAFGKGLVGQSKDELKRWSLITEDTLGLTWENLIVMQDMAMAEGGGKIKRLMAGAKKAYEDQRLASEAANRQANWIKIQMEEIKLAVAKFWNEVGKPVVKFMEGFGKPFMKMMSKITGFVNGKNTKETLESFRKMGEAAGEWVSDRVMKGLDFIKNNWETLVGYAKKILSTVTFYVGILGKVFDWVLKIADALGPTATAVVLVGMKFGLLSPIIGGVIKLIMGAGGMNVALKGTETAINAAASATSKLSGMLVGSAFMLALAGAALIAKEIADTLDRLAESKFVSAPKTGQIFTDWAGNIKKGTTKQALSGWMQDVASMHGKQKIDPAQEAFISAAKQLESDRFMGAAAQLKIKGSYGKRLEELGVSGQEYGEGYALIEAYAKQLGKAAGSESIKVNPYLGYGTDITSKENKFVGVAGGVEMPTLPGDYMSQAQISRKTDELTTAVDDNRIQSRDNTEATRLNTLAMDALKEVLVKKVPAIGSTKPEAVAVH